MCQVHGVLSEYNTFMFSLGGSPTEQTRVVLWTGLLDKIIPLSMMSERIGVVLLPVLQHAFDRGDELATENASLQEVSIQCWLLSKCYVVQSPHKLQEFANS